MQAYRMLRGVTSMLRTVLGALIVVAALASIGAAQFPDPNRNPFSLGVFPSLWWTKMTKVDVKMADQVGNGPVLGEWLEFDDDFGLRTGTKLFPGIKVMLGYNDRLFFRGAYQELRFRGSTWLDSDYELAGYTAKQGTFLKSSFKLDYFDAGLQYNLVNHEDIQLGIIGEAKIYNLRIRASGEGQEGDTGPVVPFSEKEEEVVYLPVLGLHLNLRPADWLGIKAEAKGMSLSSISSLELGVENYTVLEAEAGVSIYLDKALALTFGYRWLRTDFELDTDSPRTVEVETKLRGFMASLDLRF